MTIAKNIYLLKKKEISMRGLFISNISNKSCIYMYIYNTKFTYNFFSTKTNSIEYKSKFVEQICLYKVATKYLHENRL